MDSKWKVSQVFNNNPLVCQLKGWPKNRFLNYVQPEINICKIKNWKERYKTELTGISSLRRQRSALNCTAIDDDDDDEEKEDKEEAAAEEEL